MNPIYSLRKQGYKVRVKHSRYFRDRANVLMDVCRKEKYGLNQLKPKGGKTVIDITAPDGRNAQGIAICRPDLDTFDRKIGNRIAVGRALKQLNKVEVKNIEFP